MTLTIHNDACQNEGVLLDVSQHDADGIRAELPMGWHVAEFDD